MNRPIKIYQLAPRETQNTLCIVPFGRYLNVKLQKASAGDILDFIVNWRRDRYILIRKATVAVNSSCFTLLLKSIYGEEATWQSISEQWRANCILDGLGASAFDTDNVLLLSVKKFIQEEYDAELERIRLAEEQARKQAEKEALRYNHPMVTDL